MSLDPTPEDLERFAKAVREGKVVVAQSSADQHWTDPADGAKYLRSPFKLGLDFEIVSVRNPMTGSEVQIVEWQIPSGFSLQFVPMFGPHYISTDLKAPPSYGVSIEVWDAFFRKFKGTLWNGTTTELCRSMEMRNNGFPLCYSGNGVIVAEPGDLVIVRLETPRGSPAPAVVGENKNPLIDFALRCFKLVPAEVKKDG